MLVLTLGIGDKVTIGDSIALYPIGKNGKRTIFAFDAPKEMDIRLEKKKNRKQEVIKRDEESSLSSMPEEG